MSGFYELGKFIRENQAAGALPVDIAEQVKVLWNEYKQPKLSEDCAVISADFGGLGSLVIRYIATCEGDELKYETGSYDYVSVKLSGTKRILWTDFSNEQPYNRQGGLYCDGSTFESLGGIPVKQTSEYREFQGEDQYGTNICFGVWGFNYNSFYGSVTFGLCIKKEKVNEFVSRLRDIINK